MALCLTACSDEDGPLSASRSVLFSVSTSWQSGRTQTRSIPVSIANPTDGNIIIGIDDYPQTLNVIADPEGPTFNLTKTANPCNVDGHEGYYYYTASDPSVVLTSLLGKSLWTSATLEGEAAGGATFALSGGVYQWSGIPAIGKVDYLSARGDTNADGVVDASDVVGNSTTHVLFGMQHATALLRMLFVVHAKYDQIRQIVITDVRFAKGETCTDESLRIMLDDAPIVLNKDNRTLVAYCYINPSVVSVSTKLTLMCTYNVYDKDADFTNLATDPEGSIQDNSSHLTRGGIKVQNTFTLQSLKDAYDHSLSTITQGKYYDLNVTLNPDSLYVLSDHDNKHLTIN